MSGATVTFEPGACTVWHTHPAGQLLIVTAGCGRVQRESGPPRRLLRPKSAGASLRQPKAVG
jgi:quercetin dioxygenase-like cupin family protein